MGLIDYKEMTKEKAMELGKKYIIPSQLNTWNDYVNKSYDSWTHGLECNNTIELLIALDERGIDYAVKLLNDQNHSGTSYSWVRALTLQFGKDAVDFYKRTSDYELTDEEIDLLNKTALRNKNESLKTSKGR